MNIANVILAAGYGTRMKSETPKVMHTVTGRPMIEWAVLAAEEASTQKPVVVVGHGREHIEKYLGDRVQYVAQDELLGTAHAAQQAEATLRNRADIVVVTYADMPLLRGETLRNLTNAFIEGGGPGAVAIAMLTIVRDDPQGFGRIVRDDQGRIQAIVEEADCTPAQRQIRELNPGIYCFDAAWLWDNLPHIPLSAKGEYYLTDMVGLAASQGRNVISRPAPLDQMNGVNTRIHLAEAEALLRQRILERHMLAGVTIIDPASTYIEDSVRIGQDTVILPGCFLRGQSDVGRNCVIGPYSQIDDSRVDNDCRITYSVVEEARMEKGCSVGPFGHLRRGAHLGPHVHMGNFGEVKNSYLGPGVKMGHFSYLGDTRVGEETNIGAGTITCNFDGVDKHSTKIGPHAFIGSGTLLVAPLELGADVRTGAGSVVTRDVSEGALVYGVPARSPEDEPNDQRPADT